MNIWNRRELITTFDLKTQDRVREILHANKIGYYIKTVNILIPAPAESTPSAD